MPVAPIEWNPDTMHEEGRFSPSPPAVDCSCQCRWSLSPGSSDAGSRSASRPEPCCPDEDVVAVGDWVVELVGLFVGGVLGEFVGSSEPRVFVGVGDLVVGLADGEDSATTASPPHAAEAKHNAAPAMPVAACRSHAVPRTEDSQAGPRTTARRDIAPRYGCTLAVELRSAGRVMLDLWRGR